MVEFNLNEPCAAPRRRNPASTRRKLLVAARREFARNGLAGARVDEIAAQAGVNKQLVYHYFGDKDAIYFAVLEWMYDEIVQYERNFNVDGLSPDQAIRKLVQSSFDYLELHPDVVALLNDENRHAAAHVRNLTHFADIRTPLLRVFSRTLSQGVREGLFRKGISPEQLYISITALSYFYFSGMPTLSAILGKDLKSRSALRARRKHVVDFVMQSLRA
ncbi:MAG: TetR family transcriptional regulator [Rhizobiales bacterium]|nr:TetR family transcriptional regulator [Hyphomicrobiales bacterium]MBN8984237.1 TetR family transcriptional regulator [Hyphomicrobiales bacterium]